MVCTEREILQGVSNQEGLVGRSMQHTQEGR
jgi:hypothetical protein